MIDSGSETSTILRVAPSFLQFMSNPGQGA